MTGRPPPRFEQRSLHPLGRRLRRLWLRHVARRFVHRHRVVRLRVGGRELKRIRFGDAWLAERAAAGLEHFAGRGLVPELEARFDDELLVEFVAGEPLERFEPESAEALARFFAQLHADGVREVGLEESGARERAARDLAFLRDAGVASPELASALERALDTLAPARVHLGWDYTDAVPRNFVCRGGRAVGIDVEALHCERLIGIGIAKSLARGEPGFRDAFLDAFRKESPIDLEPALPFLELCFALAWLKNRCLKGSRIDVGAVSRFAGTP